MRLGQGSNVLKLAIFRPGPEYMGECYVPSHLFNCDSYGKYVSLLGGEIILGHDFKTFTQF